MKSLMTWIVVLVSLAAAWSSSGLTLAWDASPGPDVVKYRVYRGVRSGAYSQTSETVGTVFYDLGLMPGKTYFYAVTAVSGAGLESNYSNEVSVFIPVPPPTRLGITQYPQLLISLEQQTLPPTGQWNVVSTITISNFGGSKVFRASSSVK